MSDWADGANVNEQTRNAVAWGEKRERERIIALLEADKATCPMKKGCPACEHLERRIAAIKGGIK